MWYKCRDWKDERPKGNSNFMLYMCGDSGKYCRYFMMHAAWMLAPIHIIIYIHSYGRHIQKAYEGNV